MDFLFLLVCFFMLQSQTLTDEQSPTTSADQPSSSPTAPPPPSKRKKQSSQDSTQELVGLATAYFKKPESESEIVARGWAIKLSRLAPDQRRFAEKIINDTLFEAELGTLTRYGVRFLTPSQSMLSPSPSVSPAPIYRSLYSSSSYGSSPSPNGFHHNMNHASLPNYMNSNLQHIQQTIPENPSTTNRLEHVEVADGETAGDFFSKFSSF